MESQDRYRDCWVLIDSNDRADDNVEHLYRHLMRQGRDGNAWFVLSPASGDWVRLEKEGFKLLALGSDEHIAAPLRDGRCCERVCTAIERLLELRPVLSPLHATQVAPFRKPVRKDP